MDGGLRELMVNMANGQHMACGHTTTKLNTPLALGFVQKWWKWRWHQKALLNRASHPSQSMALVQASAHGWWSYQPTLASLTLTWVRWDMMRSWLADKLNPIKKAWHHLPSPPPCMVSLSHDYSHTVRSAQYLNEEQIGPHKWKNNHAKQRQATLS